MCSLFLSRTVGSRTTETARIKFCVGACLTILSGLWWHPCTYMRSLFKRTVLVDDVLGCPGVTFEVKFDLRRPLGIVFDTVFVNDAHDEVCGLIYLVGVSVSSCRTLNQRLQSQFYSVFCACIHTCAPTSYAPSCDD